MNTIWGRISRLFQEFDREMRAFESEVERLAIGGVSIQNRDGHISISGPYKSLTIDGRIVRLKS